MPFVSEKQRKWMHANEPAMAERWEREGKRTLIGHEVERAFERALPPKLVAGVGRLEELSDDEPVGKWAHIYRPPKIGARKPKRTRAAKPAAPARPAAPIVSFATHASYEQMLDEMYARASTTMYGGTGASPAPRDPIPDYADIYWQPRDNTNVEREREANDNRRATLSKQNQGKFGFHGGADVEPEIRYDQDDFPMSTRRGMEQSPTKRASTQTAQLNAYDQPINTEARTLVVKRNTPVVEHREESGPQRKPQRILAGKFSRTANMPPKPGGRLPVAKVPPVEGVASAPKLVVKR